MNTPHSKKADKHKVGGAHARTPAPAQDLGNIDLYEEEISAEKHLRDLGEAQVNKRVLVSTKELTVPVIHDELTVERTPLEKPTFERPAAVSSSFDEIRIPLCEEEATTEKHTEMLGEVRLHKRVVATEKQITVPMMHEELRLNRVPADGRDPIMYADGMFEQRTYVVPLHDEQLEIHKHPIVRESVRLTKTPVTENITMSTELRREELDIEEPEARTETWKESRDPHDFSEGDQVIPLFKEEAEIRKYPVLREEVRVGRDALQEERTATAETLKEELDIEKSDGLGRDLL